MCLNDIPVAASSPSELVLGLDWLQFVCNSTSELVFHLSSVRHPYRPEQDADHAVQHQLWRLCIKSQHTLLLSYEPLPTGAVLHNVCAPAGRPIDQRTLIITSKRRIPEERYRAWDEESADESSDYELSSNCGDDDGALDFSPKKGKGKKVVVKKEPASGSTVDSKASGISTRLSTGTIEWNPMYIADSDEEDLPASLLPISSTSAATEPTTSNAIAGPSSSTDSTFAGASTPSTAVGSSSSASTSAGGSASPLFTSMNSPSPSPELEDPFANDASTFFTTGGPNASPNNSRWAAAVAAAAAGASSSTSTSSTAAFGTFPGSVRDTRPNPWG
ncbi:hypothetical protein B0H10DRAFT_2441204 [Mycena sp. CBHHK59/15]|nr:hypothetical protein B0H10DRAFT_2441204 [Mycena sp. CBHHK59/15]